MRCEALAGLMLLAGCGGAVPTAGRSEPTPTADLQVPVPEGCATDAEELAQTVTVRVRPNVGAEEAGTLAAGRFLLRCAVEGDWQFVRFPDVGEKVDCSFRQASDGCAGGWIPATALTRRYD